MTKAYADSGLAEKERGAIGHPALSHAHDSSLDLLRIFATVLVILLHCIAPYVTNAAYYGSLSWWLCNIVNGITRTAVPLFFMMSGYLLLKSPKTLEIGTFYRKRFIRIMVPFLVWDAIYFLYDAMLALRAGASVDWTRFFRELIVSGSSYHLWFVYTLAGVYLLAPFLKRMTDACTTRQLVWLLVLVTFTGTIRPLLNTVLPVYIFLFAPLMEGYIGYFLLGYLLGTRTLPRWGKNALIAAGLLIFATNIALSYVLSSPEQIVLPFNGIYGIVQFICAAALFVLFCRLPQPRGGRTREWLAALAGVSYGVYLCHVLLLRLCERFLPIHSVGMGVIVNCAVVSVVGFAAMSILARLKRVNRLFL